MTKYAGTGVAGEDALKAAFGIVRAVGNDDHAGMLGKTDADAATIVNRYPRRAGGSVDKRVEQRPIGNCIAAIEHSFGFSIGRCDGT